MGLWGGTKKIHIYIYIHTYIHTYIHIYKDPTFETTSSMGEKAEGVVGSGIRQGCPLSPYLFIIVLTVIFEDVDYALLAQGQPVNTWSVAKPVYDLAHADDALLLSLTSILAALEGQAKKYGMHLKPTQGSPVNFIFRWQPCSDHNASTIPRNHGQVE